MSEKPNGHASDCVGDSLVLADAGETALSDSVDAAQAAIMLRSQLTALQLSAARNAERQTIETLVQDAMRRYIEARKKNDYQAEVQCVREIMRYESYLVRRGFV